MIKIMDTSSISTMDTDICSVDLLKIVSSNYIIGITESVQSEMLPSTKSLISSIHDKSIVYFRNNPVVESLCRKISEKYWRLHAGEINCISEGLLLSSTDKQYYLIIDDGVARSKIKSITSDPDVLSILGVDSVNLRFGGCIGLIIHLRDKGLLSERQCCIIADELEDSPFRITPDILHKLRTHGSSAS